MTYYHPVTKEELEQIATRKKPNPLGEGHGSKILSMGYYEIDELIEKILSRPDPLALLEAWREYRFGLVPFDSPDMLVSESEIISDLRIKPSAVRERGIEDGWY